MHSINVLTADASIKFKNIIFSDNNLSYKQALQEASKTYKPKIPKVKGYSRNKTYIR